MRFKKHRVRRVKSYDVPRPAISAVLWAFYRVLKGGGGVHGG